MGQYQGGYVIEPKVGMHKNVIVLDFRSLFPSIIVTHNISPETLNCSHKKCKKENMVPGINRWFCTKKEGIVPKRIRKMIKDRELIKKHLKNKKLSKTERNRLEQKQTQLKLATNIQYGLFSFKRSDHYCVDCGEAASSFGRFYLKKTMKIAEQDGFNLIYADTDGLYLTNVKTNKAKKFVRKINKELPGIIKLEFRGMYKKGLFVTTKTGKGAKKKYALIDKKGNLLIRGFETRREDWCKLAKDTQKMILKCVLSGKINEAVNHTKAAIKKIKNKKIKIDDLILSVRLTKSVEKYKVSSAHVEVAKKMNHIKEGTIVKFIITKGSGPIFKRAVDVRKASIKNIDENYYIKKQIIPAAMRVLRIFGIKESDLK